MAAKHYKDKTDEWMTPIEVVDLCYDLLKVPTGAKVLNPFDTAQSQFVKRASARGYVSIHGINDYVESDSYEFDYMATNPPYSFKDQIIERALQYGKPAALVLPLDSMGGVRRHKLFKQYGYPSIYVPSKRISYIDEQGTQRKGAAFHSVVMLLNTGESCILWE